MKLQIAEACLRSSIRRNQKARKAEVEDVTGIKSSVVKNPPEN